MTSEQIDSQHCIRFVDSEKRKNHLDLSFNHFGNLSKTTDKLTCRRLCQPFICHFFWKLTAKHVSFHCAIQWD